MAESFVDSFKCELITDRIWQTRSQLELAIVEWVAWFNHDRLHQALGDIPPVEYEDLHTAGHAAGAPASASLRSPSGLAALHAGGPPTTLP